MTKLHVIYEGELHTLVLHERTGQTLHTDAPPDHSGKGTTFSPTDLLAASLASCIATTLGMYADKKGLDLRGMEISIEKIMSSDRPRRIVGLPMTIKIPLSFSEEQKEEFLKVAKRCPVHHSLHPEIDAGITFQWKEG